MVNAAMMAHALTEKMAVTADMGTRAGSEAPHRLQTVSVKETFASHSRHMTVLTFWALVQSAKRVVVLAMVSRKRCITLILVAGPLPVFAERPGGKRIRPRH